VRGSMQDSVRHGAVQTKPFLVPCLRLLRGLAFALVALASVPSAAHAADPGDTLGVYPGAGNITRLGSFQDTLGRKVSFGHDYLNKSTWTSMLDVGWMANRWKAAGFANRMVFTVPMVPDTVGSSTALASGAAGDFNSHFKTLAERLVAHGFGSSVLRIGPEFNGNWFNWTIKVPNGAANFAAYWRKIVKTVRAVPGAHFKFDWAANAGSSYVGPGQQLEAADAWPGADYVDYVGLDVYDQSWAPGGADPVARWNEIVNQHNGMAWQAAFAASKDKPLTYPEWGLVDRADGHGGGDNPYFIQQMHDWIAAHDVAYSLYFEDSDPNAQYAVFSGQFPNAAQTFVKLFGGSGGGGDSESFDFSEFARLCIDSARISPRTRRLKLLATITRHASGAARVELLAGGRKTRFSKRIKGGRVKVSRKVSRKQARKGTGIVTISYRGNSATTPQTVRLRLAPRKAHLRLGAAPTLNGGHLSTFGTISKLARGVVRLQLKYEINGRIVTRQYKAKIHGGRWRLDKTLSQIANHEIAGRRGPVHAYALYTGSLPRRIGGQMKSYELLGPA
jgi:Glycosyl hydrolase family 26